MLNVFNEGLKYKSDRCDEYDAKNWGEAGKPGLAWQDLTKKCPAYAIEHGAGVVRKSGGTNGEFGPLRTKAAELVGACVDIMGEARKVIDNNPGICNSL